MRGRVFSSRPSTASPILPARSAQQSSIKWRYVSMLFPWIGILVLSQLAVNERPVSPKITLEVTAARLMPYDPLVVRVVLENVGKTPIFLDTGFEARSGLVRLER